MFMVTLKLRRKTMTDPIEDLKTNALAIAAKPLLDALASLQANPSTFNLAAQGVALQGALIGAAPALEALGIKDLAAALEAKVLEAITPPAPAAA
jgi:hypothetical protein